MKKKLLYVSNVDLEGGLIPGVVEKIKGQCAAFDRNNTETAVLYPGKGGEITIAHTDGSKRSYKGARDTGLQQGFLNKLKQHLSLAWYGSLNFDHCAEDILAYGYDAIYLRFYLPGKDLIHFLKKVRQKSPGTLILLEYPTLNVGPLMKTDKARWISYLINKPRIKRMNAAADFIITLTKDKVLFDKPAVFMPNGFEFSAIKVLGPVQPPDPVVLIGVASDCAHYHGYDKIIKGLGEYYRNNPEQHVEFRIISSLIGHNMAALRKLAEEEHVQDRVLFCGTRTKAELAGEYQQSHIGIGTLALHRIGLMDNYSLKHREYAAFGLPFIMSLGDDAFEDSPFVFTVERDEAPVDIKRLLDFYQGIVRKDHNYPEKFRSSMQQKLSWDTQMQQVFSVIHKR